jgi:hypothetical protein
VRHQSTSSPLRTVEAIRALEMNRGWSRKMLFERILPRQTTYPRRS